MSSKFFRERLIFIEKLKILKRFSRKSSGIRFGKHHHYPLFILVITERKLSPVSIEILVLSESVWLSGSTPAGITRLRVFDSH